MCKTSNVVPSPNCTAFVGIMTFSSSTSLLGFPPGTTLDGGYANVLTACGKDGVCVKDELCAEAVCANVGPAWPKPWEKSFVAEAREGSLAKPSLVMMRHCEMPYISASIARHGQVCIG